VTNVFPNPDGLSHQPAAGATLGTYWNGYIGVRADGGTTWGVGKAFVRSVDVAATNPAATVIGSTGFEGKGHGFVRRETIPEDGANAGHVRVRASLSLVVTNPPAPPGLLAGHVILGSIGCMARVQGGTLVEPGGGDYDPVIYYDQPSFYAALVKGNANGDITLVLERWNAGTRTELATSTVTPDPAAFLAPSTVELDLQNTISDVTVTMSLIGAPLPGQSGFTQSGLTPLGPYPEWNPGVHPSAQGGGGVTVLTYVDSSGSRISTTGRAGMVIEKENTATVLASTLQWIGKCHSLEAQGEADAIILRDEFTRWAYTGRLETNRWSQAGTNIQSDVAFDRSSELFRNVGQSPYTGGTPHLGTNGFQGWPARLETAVTLGLEFRQEQNSPAQEQLAAWSIGLVDSVNQKVSIDVRHQDVDSALFVGIVLRMSQVGPNGQAGGNIDYFSGYVATIGGGGDIEVWRRQYSINAANAEPEDDSILIGEATIAHSGAVRELTFEAIEVPGPDPPGAGPVQVRVWVDTVAVTLAVAAGAAGTVVDLGSGILEDRSSFRLGASDGMGLFARYPATGAAVTKTVEVREVTIETPGAAVVENEDDLASIVLPAETDGVSGDLGDVFTPSEVVEAPTQDLVARARAVAGHQFALALVTGDREARRLVGRLDHGSGEWRALLAFYDDHRAIPFNWTPPGESARIWWFASPLDYHREGPNAVRVEFDVVEAL